MKIPNAKISEVHVKRKGGHLLEGKILLGAYNIYTEPILFICIRVMADLYVFVECYLPNNWSVLLPTMFPGSLEKGGPKHSTNVPFSAEVAVPLSVDE